MSHFLEECMAEDAFVYYKFKNRKTGELIDAVLAFKNVEDHDPALKKFFDIHEYKIVEDSPAWKSTISGERKLNPR
jgi:hypothetical protein